MSFDWESLRRGFRDRVTGPKVAVYTAVTRSYDKLLPPSVRVSGWSYICFTDDCRNSTSGWEVRALPPGDLDAVRLSRLPKILPHLFLPEHDQSVWIDANLRVIGDLDGLRKIALANADIAFFRHGARRPSVAAEIQACAELGKAPLEVMKRQYETYRIEGFADDARIIPESGVIVRRHHRTNVRKAMSEWWVEVLKHSTRDQISLPYVIWRNSLTVTLLDWDLRASPWFSYEPHTTPPA